MIDIPIIFSAPMIQALLAERKTMTRRLAWRERKNSLQHHPGGAVSNDPWAHSAWRKVKPGDRLWVREGLIEDRAGWLYAADHQPIAMDEGDRRIAQMVAWAHHKEQDYAPSIHMPRWASRLTLVVTGVKIERLQEITHDECVAEGADVISTGPFGEAMVALDGKTYHQQTVRLWFHRLWDSLHGEGAWDANPDVVALAFEVHKVNIDTLPKAVAA